MKTYKIHTADELDKFAENNPYDDSDYRRGYMHGSTEILRLIERGVPASQVREFVSGPLYEWKYKAERKNGRLPFVVPPEFSY